MNELEKTSFEGMKAELADSIKKGLEFANKA
jgi:hypothetical protein